MGSVSREWEPQKVPEQGDDKIKTSFSQDSLNLMSDQFLQLESGGI